MIAFTGDVTRLMCDVTVLMCDVTRCDVLVFTCDVAPVMSLIVMFRSK